MGAGEDRVTCAGAPLDAMGNVKDTINDCPFAPAHVIVGLFEHPKYGEITLVATSCDLHRRAIMDYLEHVGIERETAFVAEIAALPTIREELGDDCWELVAAVAS